MEETLLEEELASAEEWAKKGDGVVMGACLDLAQTYAQRAGKDISSDVERIRGLLKKI